jgi:hypothetical protein
MTDEQIKEYLNGATDDEDQARHALAAEGPNIIAQLLRVELARLKGWGELLQTMGGTHADNMIDHIRIRTENLLAEILRASPQHGRKIGEQLIRAMQDPDADIRTLATLLTAGEGIPRELVTEPIIQRFQHDRDNLVKLAAAAAVAFLPNVPEPVVEKCGAYAVEFLERVARPSFPRLVWKVKLNFGTDDSPEANLLIIFGAIHRLVAAR